MNSYHNTTQLKGKELVKAERNAESQEMRLLKWFKYYRTLTASQAHTLFPDRIPLTSIRRAMTNLMNEGFIEKTEEQREGIYGKPEYVYKIKLPVEEKQLKLF